MKNIKIMSKYTLSLVVTILIMLVDNTLATDISLDASKKQQSIATIASPEPYKAATQIAKLDIAKIRDWDCTSASRVENGTRVEISLNQFWAFQPVADQNVLYKEADNEWGYFIVPGYWVKGIPGNYMRTSDGIAVTEWRGIPFTKGGVAAWYKRILRIPEQWWGQKIELVLEDVCGTAEVFIGSEKIAEKISSEIGIITADISQLLRRDKEFALFVRNAGQSKTSCGLGNSYLRIRPGKNFGNVAWVTSVSQRRIDFTFHDANAPKNSTLLVTIHNATDQQLYSQRLLFAKNLSCDWIAPTLWTPDNPQLYSLNLTLSDSDGKKLDQATYRLGFREFAARDGGFFLNDQPIIIKAETAVVGKGDLWSLDFHNNREYMQALFTVYKKLHLNTAYLAASPTEEILSLADEMGLMLLIKGPYFTHKQLDSDPDTAFARLENILQSMASNPVYFRHPSQIGFLIDVWYGYNAGCTNPNYVGLMHGDPNQSGIPAIRSKRLNQMAELYKRYFPHIECFTGGSGAVDNIYGTHIYHTWGAPSAELRAFFEQWDSQRQLPIFVGETQLPYIGSYFDLENFHGGGTPYVTENAARILGDKAYNYRTTISSRPFHTWGTKGWFWNQVEKKDQGEYGFAVDSAAVITAKYIDEIIPGWRFHRLTGYGTFDYSEASFAMQNISPQIFPAPVDYSARGFKPENFDNGNARRTMVDLRSKDYDLRPTLVAAPFTRAMTDLSAAIFDHPDDLLLQNHCGYSGDILEKSLIIFNDTDASQRFQLLSTLVDGQNGIIPLGCTEVETAPFEHKVVPISIPLPNVGNRDEFTLKLTLKGEKTLQLSYQIQVFARPSTVAIKSPLYLWDPEGILSQHLSGRLNFTKLATLDNLPQSGILIVGREALSKLSLVPDWNAVTTNGLNILFMEQSLNSSPELMKVRSRQVFINAPAHPIFDGLAETDFSYWNDAHSLAPAKTQDQAGINWSDWGNRNMVASYAFRRPQHGNMLSLLVCGFDLFQTPLLEKRNGKGRWIASQLEISERIGSDPVATRLFDNLLRYLDRPLKQSKTLFFGSETGVKLLKQFAVNATPVKSLDQIVLADCDTLLISTPDWSELKRYRMELCEFVYFGGKVLYWHAGEKFDPSWLPFTMDLTEQKSSQARLSTEADSVWRNGFGQSELYWREEQTLTAFSKVPPHFASTSPAVLVQGKFGSGEWIFTTLNPELFSEVAVGKTVRLLSALLTSLGVNIDNNSIPYIAASSDNSLDLSEQKWEFITDENNIGFSQGWHLGQGEARWLKGLIADGVEVRVGQPFETFLGHDYDGYVWYRLYFDCPDKLINAEKLYFVAGAIDDTDEVYLNGQKIGSTGKDIANFWQVKRNYLIPPRLLKKQGNLLVVRVLDEKGDGGIVKTPVAISTEKILAPVSLWQTPWPQGAWRDYNYKADLIRMY